jgi:hypothetical protein
MFDGVSNVNLHNSVRMLYYVYNGGVMYHCDGCGRGVRGTKEDPLHWPGHRKLCTGCLHIHAPDTTRQRVPSEVRAAGARARWAALSPEQQAARVAAMRKGRNVARANVPEVQAATA